jgi:hypothetical protein
MMENEMNEKIATRIMRAIMKYLTNEQLREFNAITDEKEKLEWLERNLPAYRKIVAREVLAMAESEEFSS